MTQEDPVPDRPQSESTAKQSSPVERAEEARLPRRGGNSSACQPANGSPGYNTRGRNRGSPSQSPSDGQQAGRGALPAESAPANDSQPEGRSERIRRPELPTNGKVEFRGSTLRSHPFTSKRFHVLLNSLFKVLFNFPSRYLSAIGLVSVFSLRWSLPPTLGCILKQPDSKEAPSKDQGRRRGLTPALGKAPIRGTRTTEVLARLLLNTTVPVTRLGGGFGAGLFPLHSPLLRESSLVSFPPLSDMLKFRG